MTKVGDIVKHIETYMPKHLAENYDNVGLLVGETDMPVEKVYLTLDPTMAVIDDAISQGVDMIITHHPYGLNSFKQVNSNTIQGKKIIKLIKNNIALYAAHTNLDRSNGTINEILANRMQLKHQSIFVETHHTKLFKLVVYVPVSHLDYVREALGDAGAGHIGSYSHCTFYQDGIGTFKPLHDSNPFMGEKGELNRVNEIRIETIVGEMDLNKVINAMKSAHPYEEPAYDVYETRRQDNPLGFGLKGELGEGMVLAEFLDFIKQQLELPYLTYVGDLDRIVKRVAVCSGSAVSFKGDALKQGIDVFVTGDIKYHDAVDAYEEGLIMIDATHFGTEKVVVEVFKDLLKPFEDIRCIVDHVSENPIKAR